MHIDHTGAGRSDPRAKRSATTGAARSALGAIALLGLVFVSACTSTQSQVQTGGQMLPRPAVVVVHSFAVSPTEVTLSEGLSSEVRGIVEGQSATPRTEQELQVGHQVADAIANNLVTEIRDLGLPAEHGSGLPVGTANAVLVTGQLVSINQQRGRAGGDRLAAGRSDVRAQVQVFELTPTSTRLIDTIEVDAKSGLQPGMAETMGMGALTGHLLVSTLVTGGLQVATETMSDTVVADADRAAKGIAKQLAVLFAEQGWTH